MGIGRPRAALVVLSVVTLAAPVTVASAFSGQDLMNGLAQLDAKVQGKSHLSSAERNAVHAEKASLIAAAYAMPISGVTYADVLTGLDCVDTDLQLARDTTKKKALAWAAKALGCERALSDALKAGGQATSAMVSGLATIDELIKDLISNIRRNKAYGLEATGIRRVAAKFVGRHFGAASIYGVAFNEHFRDLECIDVKIEANRVSGASACAHRLRRLVKHAG